MAELTAWSLAEAPASGATPAGSAGSSVDAGPGAGDPFDIPDDEEIGRELAGRHRKAYPERPSNGNVLETGGAYQWRGGGEARRPRGLGV